MEQPIPNNLAGHLLIAETELEDPNFFRTVVLIVHHNEEGAFGLVINRKSEVVLSDVLDGVADSPAGALPVYVGGPVQNEYLFVLHEGLPAEYCSEHLECATAGVYFEPSFGHVARFMASSDYAAAPVRPLIRVFAGYSGWSAGQLEGELRESAWLLLPAQAEIVFDTAPEASWQEALSRKGDFYRIVAQTGFKPSLN